MRYDLGPSYEGGFSKDKKLDVGEWMDNWHLRKKL